MKNMFKLSLVAATLAGVCSTAQAARIDVYGGTLDLNATGNNGYEVLTAANEFLEVNTHVTVQNLDGTDLTGPNSDHFRVVLEDQYSVDDKVFLTFSGTSIDVNSLPISRIGYIIPTPSSTPALSAQNPVRGVITLGRVGSTVVDGNTVVEYRVTNVSEGANTQNAVIFFGATPVVPSAGTALTEVTASPFRFTGAGVRASNGVNVTFRAFYKNNGAEFDTGGTRRTNVALIRTANQLDGNYAGNLTARIDTFDRNVADTGSALRRTFVEDSGQGRTNNVAYGATFAADDTVSERAAKVTSDLVANRFNFQFSVVENATGWDFRLTPANITTDFTLAGTFAHILGTNTSGATIAVNGSTLAGQGIATRTNVSTLDLATSGFGAGCFDEALVADQAATFPTGTTPSSLRFRCAVGTDFDFATKLPATWAAGSVARQDFNLTAVMTYTGTAGSANKTVVRNVGTWSNDGTSVFVPYMPYGTGISQLLFVSNTGPTARQIAVDVYTQNHDRTATTRFKDAEVLNLNVTVHPGLTRLTEHVRDALIARGLWNGTGSQSFSMEFIVSGDTSEIEIYSGYNVNNDRNLVINNSNGRKDIAVDSNIGPVRQPTP